MSNLRLSLLTLMAMVPPEPEHVELDRLPTHRGKGFATKFPAHGREKHEAISKRRKASKSAARNRKRNRS